HDLGPCILVTLQSGRGPCAAVRLRRRLRRDLAEANARAGPAARHFFKDGHVMLKQIRSCLVLWTVILAASTVSLAAQESRGTLQGRVTDSSGAAVPGATVDVLNL